jgi:hypothetical protein
MKGKYTLRVLEDAVAGLVKVRLVEWCPDCGKRDEFVGMMRPSELYAYKIHGAACCESCAATRDEIAFATGY